MQGSLPHLPTANTSNQNAGDFASASVFSFASLQQSANLKEMRSWKEFFDIHKLSKPSGFVGPESTTVQHRLNYNLIHYRTNYLLFIASLALFMLLSNFSFLFCTLFIILGYFGVQRLPEGVSFRVLSRFTLTKKQIWGIWAVVSLFLMFATSAAKAVFWLMGISGFLIGIHASLKDAEPEGEYESVNQLA
jgi:hypothetical protein